MAVIRVRSENLEGPRPSKLPGELVGKRQALRVGAAPRTGFTPMKGIAKATKNRRGSVRIRKGR